MKKLLVDLVCLLSGKSQEHTGVRPLSLLIISITLCYLSTDTFTTVLLRGRKEIPAAFYEVFLLRHLHIQCCDRLGPVMAALCRSVLL